MVLPESRCFVLCSADSLYCYETIPVGYKLDVPVHSPAPAPKEVFVALRDILVTIPTAGPRRLERLQSDGLKDALTKALRALCDLFRTRHGQFPVLPQCKSYFEFAVLLLKITFFKEGNLMTERTARMYLSACEFWKVFMEICQIFARADADSWSAVPFGITEECLGRFNRAIPVFMSWKERAHLEASIEIQDALRCMGGGPYTPFASGFAFKDGVMECADGGGASAAGVETKVETKVETMVAGDSEAIRQFARHVKPRLDLL